MASDNSNILVDEKLAVSLFLDSLLRETDNEYETEDKPIIDVEIPNVEILTEHKVITEKQETQVKIQDDIISESDLKIQPQVETKEVTQETHAPEEAKESFQVLLFKVAGLKLAVPLIELSGVIEWKESVTEMPGHADFYMGILQHLNYKIPVIDTARMVLPAKKLEELNDNDPRERVKHIVLIDDYGWGLACDEIGEVITLNSEDVRWRMSKTSRGWLAGTVIEHMCALLNSDGFSTMIEKGTKSTD